MYRRTAGLFLFTTLILATLPAAAQSDDTVRDRIEALHGNAEGFAEPFRRLADAMRDGDAVRIAELCDYPLRVNANGESYDVQTAEDFVNNFDALLMQETRDAIAAQSYGALFVNSDGVMLADGAVWMGAVCDDDDCSTSHWAVIGINN